MTRPRRTLVSLSDTPYYHCISRCVRRAFLCGRDRATGADYEHRRQWVVDRLAVLTRVFTVDVCAYAVMSNHTHLVVRINREAALTLSEEEVIARWTALFARPLLIERYQREPAITEAEAQQARAIIATWRERLSDLSWFMRCLNEHIARLANAEDGCTGRFWEGRYKCQALLDEAALLTCMSYVDLNPIRAGMAAMPEESEYTSVLQRIREVRQELTGPNDATTAGSVPLLPFKEAESLTAPDHLPFALMEYLQLVDWSGRAIREGKRGHIDSRLPPLLTRLGIDPHAYLHTLQRPNRFGIALGTVEALQRAAERLRQRYLRGVGEARRLFPRFAT